MHVWTLRDENQFMATNFRRGTDPNAQGDAVAEARAFLDAGVDGIFTDHADTAVEARQEWRAAEPARGLTRAREPGPGRAGRPAAPGR